MDTLKNKYQEFISDPERRRVFEREALSLGVSELICELMEDKGLSKTELAKKIGSSKSHVSQLLNGSRNMTVHTLSDLGYALGHKMLVTAVPLNGVMRPRYISASEPYWPQDDDYPECVETDVPVPVAA